MSNITRRVLLTQWLRILRMLLADKGVEPSTSYAHTSRACQHAVSVCPLMHATIKLLIPKGYILASHVHE